MTEMVRLVTVAVQFLTRIPVGAVPVRDGDLRRAAGAFPLVGALVAGVGVGVRAAAGWAVGPVAATVLALTAMVAVTGAFHEDGLADTADGLWGGWNVDERLAIMRDSRIGTYGTVALAATLLLRFALVAPLDVVDFTRVVVTGHVLGRAGGNALASWLPPARAEGHGHDVAGPLAPVGIGVTVATVAVTVVVATGPWLWVPLLAGGVALVWCARLARARVGGVTGDVLGGANQVVHLAAMVAVTALLHRGVL